MRSLLLLFLLGTFGIVLWRNFLSKGDKKKLKFGLKESVIASSVVVFLLLILFLFQFNFSFKLL